MKNKTWVRLLLAILVLALLIPCVVSCGKNRNEETTTADKNVGEKRDDLPDTLDFGGQEVKFLTRSFDIYKNEITMSETVENDIDRSVVHRQNAVEQRLNVEIVNDRLDGSGTAGYIVVMDALKNEIAGGSDGSTDGHDIIVNNMYHTNEYVKDGLLVDLKTMPYMDLDKSYYSQNYDNQAIINGKLYTTTGDASLTFIRFAFVTLFNKKLMIDYGIDDLYQTVFDDEWTIDYQIELCNTYGNLVEGHEEENVYSLITNTVLGVDPYTSSLQLKFVEKDNNGNLVTNLGVKSTQERFTTGLTKVLNLFSAQYTNVLKHATDDGELATAQELFSVNRALFTTQRLSAVEGSYIQNMEAKFGVIPMPKLNKEDKYQSYCHDLMSVFGVSKSVANANRGELVGAVLEAFFGESGECRNALFEKALKYKYQATDEAAQVLDTIIDGVYIDAGWIYSGALNDFALLARSVVQSGEPSITGYWRANKTKFGLAITELQTAFEEATK